MQRVVRSVFDGEAEVNPISDDKTDDFPDWMCAAPEKEIPFWRTDYNAKHTKSFGRSLTRKHGMKANRISLDRKRKKLAKVQRRRSK